MKKLAIITLIALLPALMVSCKKSASEGWVNDNTYRMVVAGSWDRDRYYIEGTDAQEGKEPKAALMLRQDAKTAAKNIAMRNFKEKMGTYIKSKTGVEDGKLIGDVIQSALSGVTVAPAAIKEEYTEMNDALITYEFQADGLKKVVDQAAEKALKTANESGM